MTTAEHGDTVLEIVADDEARIETGSEAGSGEESAEPVPTLELPEDPDEAIAVLVRELWQARVVAAEAIDKWKRSAAEFDNYRKRAQRDQAAMIARSSERVLARLLPVLDSLDAAVAMDTGATAGESLRQGVAGTRDLLLSTLAREGMEPIEALGAVFDPNLHEAAQMGEGSGTMVVKAEWRRGYVLDGKVVRAALVAVGYDPDHSGAPGEEDPEETVNPEGGEGCAGNGTAECPEA